MNEKYDDVSGQDSRLPVIKEPDKPPGKKISIPKINIPKINIPKITKKDTVAREPELISYGNSGKKVEHERVNQKEVVIIREIEKKHREGKIVKKFKKTLLAVILIIALTLAGVFVAWTTGMDDLRDDRSYLIVVVYKDVPKAASVYDKYTKQSEVIEVTELGAISNKKEYLENAEREYGTLDRMIVIDVETLKALSTDKYITYENGQPIYVDEMYDWLVGSKYPRTDIMGYDEPSLVNAKMLKSWIDHYSGYLLGGYGGYSMKVVMNAYRAGKIVVYPANSALFIVKYVAIERILFPLS